jgi:hypothetical protein
MNTANQMHHSTLNMNSYNHQSTMNEANQVNTTRMNTATSMQTSQYNYNDNNHGNGNYNNGSPYGSRCWASSFNSGNSGSEAGSALGSMAVGALVASLPRQAQSESVLATTHSCYYSNGSFMTPSSGGYQVVAPPMGATVTSVPPAHTRQR